MEERGHLLSVRWREHGETRHRRPANAIEGGRQPPDTALAPMQLRLFLRRVLQQVIGRIGHHGVDGIGRLAAQPIRAVRTHKRRSAKPHMRAIGGRIVGIRLRRHHGRPAQAARHHVYKHTPSVDSVGTFRHRKHRRKATPQIGTSLVDYDSLA